MQRRQLCKNYIRDDHTEKLSRMRIILCEVGRMRTEKNNDPDEQQ